MARTGGSPDAPCALKEHFGCTYGFGGKWLAFSVEPKNLEGQTKQMDVFEAAS